MASIAKTAFEVSVSNITRNNIQNVPGYFGTLDGSTFTPDICPAGFLVIRNALVKSEGYEAQNIKNGNTWQMVTAANGAPSIGRPGDHTGIFAFNTYDVRQLDDGVNVWKVGANFLGLELPADIRGDFTEIIIGEQYTFGEGNFSTAPVDSTYKYATISNGLLVASATPPADGSGVYFEILRSKRFTEGGRDAGFIGYVVEAKRADIAVGDTLPAATSVDAGKALMVNNSGEYALTLPLPAATAADEGKVLAVDSNGDPAWSTPSGGSGALIVTISATEPPNITYSVDKTAAEVAEAFEAGRPVYGVLDAGGNHEIYRLYVINYDGNTPVGYGLTVMVVNTVSTCDEYEEGGDTTVTFTETVLAVQS